MVTSTVKISFSRSDWRSNQFTPSLVSNSLRPHGLQDTRLPCPSPSPRDCSNSCPLSQWCHLILCCPLFLLPSIFPSIRVFSNDSVFHIKWPKYWSFSFSISPSSEYSGLVSFKIDCNTSCYNHIWGVCMVNTCRNWSKRKSRKKIKETAVEMPGIEPGASYMQSMRSTTELHPPPSSA